MSVDIAHALAIQEVFPSLEVAAPHRECYGEFWLTDLRVAVLTCSICYKEFDFDEKFLHHCLEHYDEKQFPAQLAHIKEEIEFEEPQPMECRLPSPVLRVGTETNVEASYKCRYCGYEFDTAEECEEHERRHDEDLGEMFLEEHASAEVEREPVMIIKGKANTVVNQLTEQAEEELTQDPLSVEIASDTKNLLYKCRLCSKSFSKPAGLSGHRMRKHAGARKCYECTFCFKKWYTSFDHKRHEKTHLKKIAAGQFKCKLCYENCSNYEELKKHLQRHKVNEIEGDARISQCKTDGEFRDTGRDDETSENEESLSITKRRVKAKEIFLLRRQFTPKDDGIKRSFVCEFCGGDFISKSTLKTHLVLHLKEPTLQCEFCAKKFYYKHNLKIHQNIHTGERPYACCYCERRFIHGSNRNKHQKICKKNSEKERKNEEKEDEAQ